MNPPEVALKWQGESSYPNQDQGPKPTSNSKEKNEKPKTEKANRSYFPLVKIHSSFKKQKIQNQGEEENFLICLGQKEKGE